MLIKKNIQNEAAKCFEKVIELSPDNPYAYYSLALTHELQENKTKALEFYYQYLGLESDEKMLGIVKDKIKQLEADKD